MEEFTQDENGVRARVTDRVTDEASTVEVELGVVFDRLFGLPDATISGS